MDGSILVRFFTVTFLDELAEWYFVVGLTIVDVCASFVLSPDYVAAFEELSWRKN